MKETLTDCKVSMDVVRQLLLIGRTEGLAVDTLLETHGVPVQAMHNDPAYMAGADFEQLLAVGLRELGHPLGGLELGVKAPQHVFGLTAYLAQTASNIESFLQGVMQVEPLLGNVGVTDLRHYPGEVHLRWRCQLADPQVCFHTIDFILATFANFLNACTRRSSRLYREVHLAHPPPKTAAHRARYDQVFRCPVQFDQPENRLILPAEALQSPINSADPELNAVLIRHAKNRLEARRTGVSLADSVTRQIKRMMDQGTVSRESVAAALSITSRTLHRKLREEGTSYRALLDAVRQDKACELLGEPRRTIQSVAAEVGFDEAHSFTRWFRQRVGQSPSEYRGQ